MSAPLSDRLAERRLLGYYLLAGGPNRIPLPTLRTEVLALDSEWFDHSPHRRTLQAMQAAATAGDPIEPCVVQAAIEVPTIVNGVPQIRCSSSSIPRRDAPPVAMNAPASIPAS